LDPAMGHIVSAVCFDSDVTYHRCDPTVYIHVVLHSLGLVLVSLLTAF
jgi:hypothetical protein